MTSIYGLSGLTRGFGHIDRYIDMLYSTLRLKLKQVVGPFGFGSILKFLLPDFLVGIIMGLSNEVSPQGLPATSTEGYFVRLGAVACGISLFTLIVETRKLFFTTGEVEEFYFVQPTTISRLVSILAFILLDLMIVIAVTAPTLVFGYPSMTTSSWLVFTSTYAFGLSSVLYLIMVSFLSLLPERIVNASLAMAQIVVVLILLALYQLPLFAENLRINDSTFFPFVMSTTGLLILFTPLLGISLVFLLSPIQENFTVKLRREESRPGTDPSRVIGRIRKAILVRSDEEEAGLLFYFSNFQRSRSFRLSTISTAATPIMVAIYWTLKGYRFVGPNSIQGLVTAQLVAPLASLVTTGILAYYFLSQILTSSKDSDAAWLFGVCPSFSSGRFVLGFRKGFLLTVHFPMTILVFLVALNREMFSDAVITGMTFYLLTHVAVSLFSMTQGSLPFTLPFRRLVSGSAVDLIFMLGYAMLIIVALFICYGAIENILMLNFFAFILVGALEFSSVRIIDKRIKVGL